MIIDSQSNMVIKHSADNPPAYEYVATQNGSNEQPYQPSTSNGAANPPTMPPNTVTPFHARPMPKMQDPTIYHYQNPLTGEQIASLLPPNHPEMICLQQGGHTTETKFGILGILLAIVWFPLGISCCLLDRRVICTRCGKVIDHGMCG
ncbi:hypothetical protein DEU56DRAFT_807108 [Suillus clintonianus]|uniref:uncharacterized protein n=1 Tax=Suillus clintonianus TaxID=1904413 RepID=UPI001B8657D9|nr:uncharacterized protein DEU56DRAFT_807108 [Suillus clintonianus]KAG2135454.1 hypothetical protein DEU56DRAFT_807108 [Suillus clintonianus]